MCIMCMAHMLMMDHGEQHQPATSVVTATGRNCAHCGYPLQSGFTFCPSCGMDLRTTACSACGQAVDPSWKTCPYCGTALSTNAAATGGHAHH
jgi:RNA polymerase subunit RPABC4/transcription elongation factor Spt4